MLSIDLPDLAEMPGCEKEKRCYELYEEELDNATVAFFEKDKEGLVNALHPIFKEMKIQCTDEELLAGEKWMARLDQFFDYYMFRHVDPDFSVMPEGYKTYYTDAVKGYREYLDHSIETLRQQPDDARADTIGVYDRGIDVAVNPIANSFDALGITQLASEYLNRKVKVDRVFLHVARHTDRNPFQFFQDNPHRPKWTNTHFDPKENTVKAICYLNEIGSHDGAFNYVPYSNQYSRDPLQNVFSRAISTGSYCHNPLSRVSVFHLPPHLRVSANFGRLTVVDRQLEHFLNCMMRTFLPSMGANIVVFDPNGLHQGGIVTNPQGERQCLQVLIR